VLLKLPAELLRCILKCLGPSVLMLLSGVCRQMRSVVEADEMWTDFLACSILPIDGTRMMIAKAQFLMGQDVHEWAMTDPYPLTNTFLLHLVDKIPCQELRSVMADTMRVCPKRLILMRLFRRGILSITEMMRLYRSTLGMRQLVFYLMQRHGCADKVLDCLESGIISFSDLKRLYSRSSNFVYAIFAADYRGKYFKLSCVSDLQDGRVTLLQLENLYLYSDPYRTYPESATGRSTCHRSCRASCRVRRGVTVTGVELICARGCTREHRARGYRSPVRVHQVHVDGGFYARYPSNFRLSEGEHNRERAHCESCSIRADRLLASYRAI
jgi:hypothetical protein